MYYTFIGTADEIYGQKIMVPLLWGMGISGDMIENLCGYLRSKTIVPEAIHSKMMNYYRQ